MKKYMIFTPVVYRVVVMSLCPIAVFAFLALQLWGMPGNLAMYAMAILPLSEIIGDWLIFDGLYKRGEKIPRFLMASTKGTTLIKQVVRVGRLRTLLYDLVFVGLAAVLGTWKFWGERGFLYQVLVHVTMIIVLFSTAQLGVLITRFFQGYLWNIVVATSIQWLVSFMGYWLSEYAIWLLIVFGIVSILSLLIHEWIIQKRITEGFFDEGYETGV
ncbi:MAG: hypothetical protein K6G30_11545 [Acetatifactor sp.]|nr:hypothetical protein [Acetatifactor sp.]